VARILLCRTSQLKTGFVHADYLPITTSSILTSVQVQLPQTSNTPLRQVGQRTLAGNFQDVYHPATITLTWNTERAVAEALFLRLLVYFQKRAAAVLNFAAAEVHADALSYVSGASISTQGLNPTQYSLDLTFLNCP